jgi:hypothetical protein
MAGLDETHERLHAKSIKRVGLLFALALDSRGGSGQAVGSRTSAEG